MKKLRSNAGGNGDCRHIDQRHRAGDKGASRVVVLKAGGGTEKWVTLERGLLGLALHATAARLQHDGLRRCLAPSSQAPGTFTPGQSCADGSNAAARTGHCSLEGHKALRGGVEI